MICPKCHTENREGRGLCSKCGSPLQMLRPSRQAVNEPGEDHCSKCDHSLADPASDRAIPPSSPTPSFAPTLTARADGRSQVKKLLGGSGEEKVRLAHDAPLDREVARPRIRRLAQPCPVVPALHGRDAEQLIRNRDGGSRMRVETPARY